MDKLMKKDLEDTIKITSKLDKLFEELRADGVAVENIYLVGLSKIGGFLRKEIGEENAAKYNHKAKSNLRLD